MDRSKILPPFLLLILILISSCKANPASVYCKEQGGTSVGVDCKNVGTEKEGWYNHLTGELVELKKCDIGGTEAGYCFFEDGSKCEEWAFYKGDCGVQK